MSDVDVNPEEKERAGDLFVREKELLDLKMDGLDREFILEALRALVKTAILNRKVLEELTGGRYKQKYDTTVNNLGDSFSVDQAYQENPVGKMIEKLNNRYRESFITNSIKSSVLESN